MKKETVKNDDSCDGKTINVNYYWEQVFKANERITIEHSYKPVFDAGVIYPSPLPAEDWNEYFGKPLEKNFCATKGQVSWVRRKKFKWKSLYYILKTANSWDGPIGKFELIIDKGTKPAIFLCTDIDLKKIKGTKKFYGFANNYKPQSDLKIAFVGKFKY